MVIYRQSYSDGYLRAATHRPAQNARSPISAIAHRFLRLKRSIFGGFWRAGYNIGIMTFQRLLLQMLLLAGAATAATAATAAAAAADVSPSNAAAPFVREWRAVMTSGEAKLLPYAGSAFRIERRGISTAQLDALETLLLPVLAAQLKRMGSRNPPSSYFRQYAAARSGRHQVILVHGYLRDTGYATDWRRKPVDAHDAELNFWDAVFIVKRHRFAKLKREGDAVRHTVIFQGAA
jgi:hypothetical protein